MDARKLGKNRLVMMRIEILNFNERSQIATIKFIDQVKIKDLIADSYQGRVYGYLEPWIKGMVTPEQRKHYWALIGDITEHTGLGQDEVSMMMKHLYKQHTDYPGEASVSSGEMRLEEVREWLQIIIEWCIENDIPFNHPEGYVPKDISRMMYKLTMKRMCVVCGKPHAEIAHFDGAVGRGRDRRKVDHTQSKFLALCTGHHHEQHKIGEQTFLKKYHLAPLKLSDYELKKLRVM